MTINPELSHLDYLRPRSDDLTGDGGFGRIRSEDILADTASSAGIRLWEEKYKFKREMLPRFVGETFGRRVCFYFIQKSAPLYCNAPPDIIYRKEFKLY